MLSLSTIPNRVMGFHLFIVFDPRDDADKRRLAGDTSWSVERGHAPFGQAGAARMAADIFPPHHEQRYRNATFTRHEPKHWATRKVRDQQQGTGMGHEPFNPGDTV